MGGLFQQLCVIVGEMELLGYLPADGSAAGPKGTPDGDDAVCERGSPSSEPEGGISGFGPLVAADKTLLVCTMTMMEAIAVIISATGMKYRMPSKPRNTGSRMGSPRRR